jgi:hypothetical protein
VWDIFVDGTFHSRHYVAADPNASLCVQVLPGGDKEVVLYFPTHTHLAIHEFSSDAPVLKPASSAPRWIMHGSSLTHCRNAAGLGETWPAIVARAKSWNLRNLGFGGRCKFDIVTARSIAKLPADLISLCLGINTAEGIFSLRSWVPAVERFLMAVRHGHPVTPLLVITPILSPPRETWDAELGIGFCRIGLQTMRRLLAEFIQKFHSAGDRLIHLLVGLQIIGLGDEATNPITAIPRHWISRRESLLPMPLRNGNIKLDKFGILPLSASHFPPEK